MSDVTVVLLKGSVTYIDSQLVADFCLDHLWSVFNTGEPQRTCVLAVLFLQKVKNIKERVLVNNTVMNLWINSGNSN